MGRFACGDRCLLMPTTTACTQQAVRVERILFNATFFCHVTSMHFYIKPLLFTWSAVDRTASLRWTSDSHLVHSEELPVSFPRVGNLPATDGVNGNFSVISTDIKGHHREALHTTELLSPHPEVNRVMMGVRYL